jgi:hypothetical protein
MDGSLEDRNFRLSEVDKMPWFEINIKLHTPLALPIHGFLINTLKFASIRRDVRIMQTVDTSEGANTNP